MTQKYKKLVIRLQAVIVIYRKSKKKKNCYNINFDSTTMYVCIQVCNIVCKWPKIHYELKFWILKKYSQLLTLFTIY